jgi:hypothetical protein
LRWYLALFCHINNLCTSDLGDPIAVSRDLGVDTGIAGESAANTPGDNSEDFTVHVQGATRVTLAGVDTTLFETSADLVGRNSSEARVAAVAFRLADNGNINLEEDVRSGASRLKRRFDHENNALIQITTPKLWRHYFISYKIAIMLK